MDFELVHSWLTEAYWSPGVSLEKVRNAAKYSSLVIGVFKDTAQLNCGASDLARSSTIPPASVGEVGELANREGGENSSGYRRTISQHSQVGYMRVVSDRNTFAWICDVWIDEPHRGRGLGQAMVNYATSHPEHQGLRRWILSTRNAHRTYEACGFVPLPEQHRWMIRLPNAQ